MTWQDWGLWFGLVFPLVFSPGPGNVLCAINGANSGFRRAVPFVFGLDLVYSSYALLAGIGLATLIDRYPYWIQVMQLLGALYIAWLGVKMMQRRSANHNQNIEPLRFFDGVISQALNVKGVSIILTMYSQFLRPSENIWPQIWMLTSALTIMNLAAHFSWTYGGAWLAARLASERAIRWQGRIYGLLLFAVAGWLFIRGFAA